MSAKKSFKTIITQLSTEKNLTWLLEIFICLI